jgi:hypothetical protein
MSANPGASAATWSGLASSIRLHSQRMIQRRAHGENLGVVALLRQESLVLSAYVLCRDRQRLD